MSPVARRHPKYGSPVGANVCTGLVATLVILAYALLAQNNDELFWSVFAFSSTIFLLPYLLLFASFLRLRQQDPATHRAFKVPGGKVIVLMMTASGLLFVLGALLLFIFPQLLEWQIAWQESAPLLIGLVLTLALGEWLVSRSLRRGRLIPVTLLD